MKLVSTTKRAGFSLVEMLVVIAVIGVIAAIAVPSISKANRGSHYAKDQRNAQQIASVAAAADAAGHDFVGTSTTPAAVIAKVIIGYTMTAADNASLSGTFFGTPGIRPADAIGAANFLTLNSGRLIYDFRQTLRTAPFYQ